MGKPLRVLIIEDSKADTELLLRELKGSGYAVESVRVELPRQCSLPCMGRPGI